MKALCPECSIKFELGVKLKKTCNPAPKTVFTHCQGLIKPEKVTASITCPECGNTLIIELRPRIFKELEEDVLRGGTSGEKTITLDYDVFAPDTDISGAVFVVTGEFEKLKRAQIKKLIQLSGGIYADNVTLTTDYLVVGSLATKTWGYGSYGSKIEKALEYRRMNNRVKIISETDFIAFMKAKLPEN